MKTYVDCKKSNNHVGLDSLETLYLKDMPTNELISREAEQSLAIKTVQAKDNFYSALLRNDVTIRKAYQAYAEHPHSFLKLAKYFAFAHATNRPAQMSLRDAKLLFANHMNQVKQLLEENEADYKKSQNMPSADLSLRMASRTEKAASLLEELGYRTGKVFVSDFNKLKLLNSAFEAWDKERSTNLCEAKKEPSFLPKKLSEATELFQTDLPTIRRYLTNLIALGSDYISLRDQMVNNNLRLVVSIARDLPSAKKDILELIQDGNIGLMRAIERFNPDRGIRFATYASYWIKQSMNRGNRNEVTSTERCRSMLRKISGVMRDISVSLGRDATNEELADALGLGISKVAEYRRLLELKFFSIQENKANSDCKFEDVIAEPERVYPCLEEQRVEKIKEVVWKVFAELQQDWKKNPHRKAERDVNILLMRFGLLNAGEKTTVARLAEHFDIATERAAQIVRKSMPVLKEYFAKHTELNDLLPWFEQEMERM